VTGNALCDDGVVIDLSAMKRVRGRSGQSDSTCRRRDHLGRLRSRNSSV
jgi:hypothetical protein